MTSYRPARAHRYLRRATQALAFVAIAVAPFLGGWQRLERNDLSSWSRPDTELPEALRARLPRGDTAGEAHENNRMLGGGVAVDYFGVPTIDPLAGALTLAMGPPTLKALIALAIPVVLALLFGRLFCGWFCPFGTLSRILAWLVELIPWSPRYRVPVRRPLRFAILGLGAVGGLLGADVVLYLALPHLLVQQSVYGAWLLGGGGAALGLLLGLIVAGLILGPTTYCAALCPTGAALRLIGHKRVVHLKLAEPKDCGRTCRRCSLSCWLQLDPASGDPGPDCDLCGRCVPECPKTNLRIGPGRGELKEGAAVLLALALV
ncbi:MAG: 4Fe-4S binding protein, partial [Sandaracinaceae bacterium]